MSDVLVDREILLGVSGGVAAWKSADLCSRLVKRGARVTVILTESAREFIGPATFEALTAGPYTASSFVRKSIFRVSTSGWRIERILLWWLLQLLAHWLAWRTVCRTICSARRCWSAPVLCWQLRR